MDPLSGVIGGASLIANMFGQNKANAQNLRIAQEANRANMNMFHYNLAYNSPSSQKARLKSAGLNSDLMYGNGVGGLVNTEVPEMRQSAPMQNIAAAFDPLTAAQIANINADTKQKEAQTENTNADTKTKLTYNEFQSQLLSNEVKFGSLQIDLGNSQIKVNDTSVLQMYKNMELADQNMQESKARIDKLRADIDLTNTENAIRKIDLKWQDKKVQAEIRKLYASANLDETSAKVANATLPYVIYGMQVDAKMKESIASLNQQQKANLAVIFQGLGYDNLLKELNLDQVKINIEQSQFNLDSDKEYKNAERGLGVALKTTEVVKNTADAVHSLIRVL